MRLSKFICRDFLWPSSFSVSWSYTNVIFRRPYLMDILFLAVVPFNKCLSFNFPNKQLIALQLLCLVHHFLYLQSWYLTLFLLGHKTSIYVGVLGLWKYLILCWSPEMTWLIWCFALYFWRANLIWRWEVLLLRTSCWIYHLIHITFLISIG